MSAKSSSSPAAAEGTGTGQPLPAHGAARNPAQHQLRNMAWIPDGTFRMGSDGFYPEERPVHQVRVDGFWMDTRPVTVEDFRRFVKATGYVTVAERPLDPGEYPDADPGLLVPGSLVFHRTAGPVDLRDYSNWWAYVPGASWRHPDGPGGRGRRPCQACTTRTSAATNAATRSASAAVSVTRTSTAEVGQIRAKDR